MNKKGFTLIELLAVIVILAIILVIAIPQILRVIEQSRRSAAKSSALGYIKAINYNNKFVEMGEPGYTMITSGDVSDINVKINGDAPTSGEVTIGSNGKVESATLCMLSHEVTYDGVDATVGDKCGGAIVFGGTIDKTTQYSLTNVEQQGLIGVAYLDPKNLSAECNSTSTLTSENTGCKKFYIYAEDSTKYTMIMYKNTTASVEAVTLEDFISAGGTENDWNHYIRTTKGLITANKQLKIDTAGWKGNPRLIEANEIAHIVGADREDTLQWDQNKRSGSNDISTRVSGFYLDGGRNSNKTSYSNTDGWKKQVAQSTGTSYYAWLYDYTSSCNNNGSNVNDSSTQGYWTNSVTIVSVNGDSNEYYAYRMGREGMLREDGISSLSYGIRPVITLSKSIFE